MITGRLHRVVVAVLRACLYIAAAWWIGRTVVLLAEGRFGSAVLTGAVTAFFVFIAVYGDIEDRRIRRRRREAALADIREQERFIDRAGVAIELDGERVGLVVAARPGDPSSHLTLALAEGFAARVAVALDEGRDFTGARLVGRAMAAAFRAADTYTRETAPENDHRV